MSDCCDIPETNGQVETRLKNCPGCGWHGRRVGAHTVASLLKPQLQATVCMDRSYRFCPNPGCGLVYFRGDDWSAGKRDLQVRVGLKETEDPVPLCYCLGFTRQDVRREVERTGTSSIPGRITAEVKAGRCACEVKNPSGTCCLGEVRKALKEALAESAAESSASMGDRS